MLKIVKLEDKVAPGNRLVVCNSASFRVKGTNARFKAGEPVEVTQKQYEYLMNLNTVLGHVIVSEYRASTKRMKPVADVETAKDIFSVMPGEAKTSSAIEKDEPEIDLGLSEEGVQIAGSKLKLKRPKAENSRDSGADDPYKVSPT